jgi:hypothetical protein
LPTLDASAEGRTTLARLVYWYTPFAELAAEVDAFVREGNAHQSRNAATMPAEKAKTYISCTSRNPPLGGIKAGDRLYIAAHGDTLKGFLVGEAKGSSVPTEYTSLGGVAALTVEQLIGKMDRDGFTWDVRDIRIYACKGAADPKSFVPVFAEKVRKTKHRDIVVYGYRGLLDRSTYPGNKKGKLMSGFAETDASKLRSQYAARPLPVPPPSTPPPLAPTAVVRPTVPVLGPGSGRPLPDVPPPATPPPPPPAGSGRPLPVPPASGSPRPPHRFQIQPDPFEADPFGATAVVHASALYNPKR